MKSCFLILRHPGLNEVVATDTYFSNTRSIEGYWCAQVFVGLTSRGITVIGMRIESEFTEAYHEIMSKQGLPHTLRQDNAKSKMSEKVLNLQHDMVIADEYTETHTP